MTLSLLTGDADSIFLHSFYNFVYYLISWPNKSLVQTVLTALGQNLKVCILLLTYLSFVDELWQSQHSIETIIYSSKLSAQKTFKKTKHKSERLKGRKETTATFFTTSVLLQMDIFISPPCFASVRIEHLMAASSVSAPQDSSLLWCNLQQRTRLSIKDSTILSRALKSMTGWRMVLLRNGFKCFALTALIYSA